MKISDPAVWGAVVGVSGTILGVIVGAFVGGLQNWLKEKREVRRLASILHQELFDQAQAVALCANYANAFNLVDVRPNRSRLDRFGIEHELPSDPVVYRAVANNLHRIGPSAGTLVACYSAIEEAKKLTLALPEKAVRRPDPSLRSDYRQNKVLLSWMRAAELAAAALEEIGVHADGSNGPDGPSGISNLIGNLRNLATGGCFHDNPTDPPESQKDN